MQKRLIAAFLSMLMVLLLLPAAVAEEKSTAGTECNGGPVSRGANDIQVNIGDFDPDFWAVLKRIGAASENNGVYYIDGDCTEIDCRYQNLTSLRGIENFPNLERLNCQDNELQSVDTSALPSLRFLDCHSNPLTGTLMFHENLEELECGDSRIDETRILIPQNSSLRVIKVDVSQVSDLSFLNGLALETLDCPYIDFGTLDFTPWQTLHDLRCDSCNLTALTVAGLSNLVILRANDNNLTSLDLSGLTALKELFVNDNSLPELILPGGVTLENAELDQTISGCQAHDNGDGTYSFDLSQLGITDLSNVTVTSANATLANGVVQFTGEPDELVYSYDTGDPNHPMTVTVDFKGGNPSFVPINPNDFDAAFLNVLLNIGAAKEDNGDYYLDENRTEIDCGYQNLTSLRGIENFPNLERLNCQDNALQSVDMSALPSLRVLDCHSNPLSGTITFHENLEELECWNSQITDTRILIPQNSSLRVVKVDASQVSSLSFLNGLALETLDCPYIDFGTLDFTPWQTLHDLRCDSCNLTALTVAGLSNLVILRANDNSLTSLDLSGLTALKELFVNDNSLPELILPGGVTLENAKLDNQRLAGYNVVPEDDHFIFDLSKLVTHPENVAALWAKDTNGQSIGVTMSSIGMLRFDVAPSAFGYAYATGAGSMDVSFTNVGVERISDGWNKIDGKWYYYENGSAVTGWKKVGSVWYYFNTDGVMQTGWQKIGNVWYYFTSGGSMATGWQRIGSAWYYFTSGGAMQTGWQQLSGKWYYFTSGGQMQTGWQKIGSAWYYFASGGAMQTGWQQISGKWYYFQSGGQMVTGWQQISGKWYYFEGSGAMATGWRQISGKWYYFQSGGQMQTGWLKLNDKWYYLEGSGAMVANTGKTINGKTYNFDANGVCLNP